MVEEVGEGWEEKSKVITYLKGLILKIQNLHILFVFGLPSKNCLLNRSKSTMLMNNLHSQAGEQPITLGPNSCLLCSECGRQAACQQLLTVETQPGALTGRKSQSKLMCETSRTETKHCAMKLKGWPCLEGEPGLRSRLKSLGGQLPNELHTTVPLLALSYNQQPSKSSFRKVIG